MSAAPTSVIPAAQTVAPSPGPSAAQEVRANTAALLPIVSILPISLYPADQPAAGLALPQSLNFHNYVRTWDAANFSMLMRSSFVVAVVVVPLDSALCILSGYAFGTMNFPGKNALLYLFLIGLLMPFEATIVPVYYDLRAFGLANLSRSDPPRHRAVPELWDVLDASALPVRPAQPR